LQRQSFEAPRKLGLLNPTIPATDPSIGETRTYCVILPTRPKIMRNLMLAALASLALSGCSMVGDRSDIEQPAYDVVETLSPAVEVRRYESRLAVEAVVDASAVDDPRSAAFRLLFDYISGQNRGSKEIAMTAPVAEDRTGDRIAMTAPVEADPRGDGRYAMRFFLPGSFTPETAPAPLDPQIRVIELAPQTMAVLRFSGARDEASVERRKTELMAVLRGSGWRATEQPVAYFYDPPWTIPSLRRNEVAVSVAPPRE
jgi:hypothetical protein